MTLDETFREVGEHVVQLRMSLSQAEWLQSQISDLACWCRGYQAGAPKRAAQYAPMGLDGIRELNIAIKRAIEIKDITF